MPATKQKDAPAFGSDFIEKHEAFERLVMERLSDGREVSECLEPHEAVAARIAFGYDEFALRRELARIRAVHFAKLVAGTSAQRATAEKKQAEHDKAHAKLLDELAEKRRELDKLERDSEYEAKRLSKLNDDIRGALKVLRGNLPKHVQDKNALCRSEYNAGPRHDRNCLRSEINCIKVLLHGPQEPGDLNSELIWIGQLKRLNPQFVRPKPQGRGFCTTPAWDAEQVKLREQLAEKQKELKSLEKECEKHEAKLESRRDYYLD